MPEPNDAAAVPQCLIQSLAEGDPHVFNRVVGVHGQVAATGNGQVEQTVHSHMRQHVVKKRHTCVDTPESLAVKGQGQADVRFTRRAGDLGAAHRAHAASS